MQAFEVDVRVDAGGRHVVTPHGEIDVGSHRQLREAINELLVAGNVHIVVDLDHTTFLDSTALGILIGARRRAYALKGSFALHCSNPELLRVFRATSLDRVFDILGP